MWPLASLIRTRRLELEPLDIKHAFEMVAVLADPRLYLFTGGNPPTLASLERLYASQTAGHSPDDSAGWLNWIARDAVSAEAVGYVQATVSRLDKTMVADVAWVVGADFHGNGYATEAAGGMVGWLARQEIGSLAAYIHPDNHASAAVARKLRFVPTPVVVDGETRWERHLAASLGTTPAGPGRK